MALVLSGLLFPMLAHGREMPWGAEGPGWETLWGSLWMLSGARGAWGGGCLALLMAAGLAGLLRTRREVALSLLAIIAAYGVALALAAPVGSHEAVVVLRYGIAIVPGALLLAAVGNRPRPVGGPGGCARGRRCASLGRRGGSDRSRSGR